MGEGFETPPRQPALTSSLNTRLRKKNLEQLEDNVYKEILFFTIKDLFFGQQQQEIFFFFLGKEIQWTFWESVY